MARLKPGTITKFRGLNDCFTGRGGQYLFDLLIVEDEKKYLLQRQPENEHRDRWVSEDDMCLIIGVFKRSAYVLLPKTNQIGWLMNSTLIVDDRYL